MLTNILKSKIHRAKVTETELEYVGSITIDETLAKQAKLVPGEKVLIANLRNGERFETYVIYGEKNSGIICINGAAAHLCEMDDQVIIMSFVWLDNQELESWDPVIVHVNKENKIIK